MKNILPLLVSFFLTSLSLHAQITGGSVTLCPGSKMLLTDTHPGGTWKSSNTTLATINSAGVTTALTKGGPLTITYRYLGGTDSLKNIYILGAPSARASASTAFVCGGGSFTLSGSASSGASPYTYAWAGPGAFTSTIGNPTITALSITSSGIYSLTVTDANGCTAKAATSGITVDVVPAAATGNSAVCSGGLLNFTSAPGGMAAYSWKGPYGYTSLLQNPTAVSYPTVAGTYTYSLTITDPRGCSSPVTTLPVSVGTPLNISVNETAPWSIVNDATYTKCGPSVTLGATGAYAGTYTWQSGGVTLSSSSTLMDSAVVNITYLVSGYYNGCTGTKTVSVIVPAPGCSPCNYFTVNNSNPAAACTGCGITQPFHTIGTNIITNADLPSDGNNNLYIAQSATMIGNIKWAGNVIFINNSSTISIGNITNTANVEFNDCHLFSCAWQGITVSVNDTSASQLKIDNNTLIENANIAVSVSAGSPISATAFFPASSYIINSDTATFNNNPVAMSLIYWPAIAPTTSTTLPFRITNTLFTGRNFADYSVGNSPSQKYPFSWPTTTALDSLSLPDPYSPVYGFNSYRASIMAVNGIYINGGYTATGPVNTYYEFSIGDYLSAPNIFDNISIYGIFSHGANATFYNNLFMNFRNVNSLGIYMRNESAYPFRTRLLGDPTLSTASGNKFYDLWIAVSISNYTEFIGWQSTISTKNDFVKGPTKDKFGYSIIETSYKNVDIRYNTIFNTPIGITFIPNDAAICDLGNVNIINNSLSDGLITTKIKNPYLRVGIYYNDVRTYPASNIYNSRGNFNISNNKLTNITSYGIQEVHIFTVVPSTLNYGTVISDNSISMCNNGALHPSGIFSQNTTMSSIESNDISGPGFNVPTPSVFSDRFFGTCGITVSVVGIAANPQSFYIGCNHTHDLNFGFAFSTSENPVNNYLTWRNNVMTKEMYGVWLGGTIGTQGAIDTPADNYWEDNGKYDSTSGSGTGMYWWTTTPGVYQTYTADYGYPSSSLMYVRNISPQNNPTNNGTESYSPAYCYTCTSGASIIDAVSYPAFPACTGQAILPGRESGHTGNATTSMATNAYQDYSLAPNPSTGIITIKGTAAGNVPVNIRIMNCTGAKVYSGLLDMTDGSAQLNLNFLITGIYIVEIVDKNGMSKNFKLVIEK